MPRLAAKARRRELLVETIDGVPAGESPFARGLLASGARIDYRGLVVRGVVAAPLPPEPEPESPGPEEIEDDE